MGTLIMEQGSIDIEKIIDVDMFIQIQNKLSDLVQFSSVTIRPNGEPVRKWSNFTPFCQVIRSSERGYRACVECDRVASLKALSLGHPIMYDCHCGLKDCAAPIIVEGTYVGCVLGGQVLIDENDREKVDVDKISHDFGLPRTAVAGALEQIAVVSQEYLSNCIEFYNFLASYAAQMGIARINQERLLKEINERKWLENYLKDMEIKQLQSKINPHILYNALNLVARTAMFENAPKTEAIVYDLSEVLRFYTKNSEEMKQLKQELHYVKKYLDIQKARFSDRLTYEIVCDEQLLEYRVLSMTIQPIVENAIIHGIEKTEGTARISIVCKMISDNDMLISVADNGAGFPTAVRKKFGNGADVNENNGLGLFGTQKRMRKIYGDNYGITIISNPGAGMKTRIEIRIPFLK